MPSMIKENKQTDSWMKAHWRPMMAWQYLVVCLFDFMLAPIFLGIYSFYTKSPYIVWIPLTVQGGGLYHLAMGAVVGITSYGKSQERVSLIQSPYAPAPGQYPMQNQNFNVNGQFDHSQFTNPPPNYGTAQYQTPNTRTRMVPKVTPIIAADPEI